MIFAEKRDILYKVILFSSVCFLRNVFWITFWKKVTPSRIYTYILYSRIKGCPGEHSFQSLWIEITDNRRECSRYSLCALWMGLDVK